MATGGGKRADEDKMRCGDCAKLFSNRADKDKGIQCELCEFWFHPSCENVDEEAFKILKQDRLHFFCGRCDMTAMKILKEIKSIQIRQDKLEEEVKSMRNRMVISR